MRNVHLSTIKFFEHDGAVGATNSTGKALIGTTYALDTIDALQHPKDCRARNFLLWVPVHHGVGKRPTECCPCLPYLCALLPSDCSSWPAGSNIHCLGQALAHALSLNRVLILLKDEEHPYYDTQYCNPEENYHDCYFEALTSCTIDDARTAAGTMLHLWSATSTVQGPVTHAGAQTGGGLLLTHNDRRCLGPHQDDTQGPSREGCINAQAAQEVRKDFGQILGWVRCTQL